MQNNGIKVPEISGRYLVKNGKDKVEVLEITEVFPEFTENNFPLSYGNTTGVPIASTISVFFRKLEGL